MITADALNLHVDPVRTEMTGTLQIPNFHFCDLDESKSEEVLTDKTLLGFCSTDEDKLESVIIDKSSTEET